MRMYAAGWPARHHKVRIGIPMRAWSRRRVILTMLAGGALVALVTIVELRYKDDEYRDRVLASRPKAYLRLGETAGNRAASQTSPATAGRYGPRVGLGVLGAIEGDPDTALSMALPGAFLDLPSSFQFVDLKPFTLETWVQPRLLGEDYPRIFSHEQTDSRGRQGYDVYIHPQFGVGFERFRDDIGQAAVFPNQLSTSEYTHVAAVFDGRRMTLVINGRLVATQEYAKPVRLRKITQPLTLGRTSDATGGTFYGNVDEVAIYRRALTVREIMEHFQSGRNG
jgi:Concanavalin A-like lectin/glucanases superfamily